ncbi:U3 small nucleolar RNA-associated protein 14 homolog A isoform X2 [Larimichthys crocea]|uniref:U3 small nucleolar RNA-associated protein 14 homolog A isoform X2 n=1 Tax=Larimichthys crocea TaxID=215358 RepID=UPI000F5DB28E|nr:U3 small nucleolar RNA-associated protein 14 homolog A isoform X2 [Larimichthys crocea]
MAREAKKKEERRRPKEERRRPKEERRRPKEERSSGEEEKKKRRRRSTGLKLRSSPEQDALRPDTVYKEDPEELHEELSEEQEEQDEEQHEEQHEEQDEEQDEEQEERRRQKLLEAISSLGARRRRTLLERSEAAGHMSEFTVSADGEAERVDLSELIGTVEQTPAVPNRTKKQLKHLQHANRTVESPLSRQESERIQRDVSFQKAAAEVSRWTAVIKQNQRAEQLVFPLNQEPSGPRPVDRVASGWTARTPLEEEIFSLLSANKQPIHDPVLTPVEEASLRAMSLEEAKQRRAELQKARALQSYYEARARRERKIKSKKYHKVHNKAKRKELLKQFDDMVKEDPASALQELHRMELARMQERMSLKHQNSGKWAKAKAVMAKYDLGARKAMMQQLEVNKELTEKVVTALNNDEEEEEQQQEEVLPDFVNDAERGVDPSNPWMRGRLTEEPTEKEVSDGAEVTVEEAAAPEEEEEEEEEEEQLSEFTTLFRGLVGVRREVEEENLAAADKPDSSAPLQESLIRVRTLENVEDLRQLHDEAATPPPPPPPHTEQPPPAAEKAGKKRKRKRGIELKEVLTKGTKEIRAPVAETVEDAGEEAEEEPDQRRLISEAFAGDDVVSDFLKDKRKQEAAGRPQVLDLTLPGWGDWGGTGLKPSRSKRRRFRVKVAPPPPRKDQRLPAVIISEKRDGAVALHQVSSLPLPFQTHGQFESAIRTPLGRTWNTESTVKKVSRPRVVTQLGAIIEPMTRDELKDRKRGADGKKP